MRRGEKEEELDRGLSRVPAGDMDKGIKENENNSRLRFTKYCETIVFPVGVGIV